MTKMVITQREFDTLLAEVKPDFPALPFGTGPIGTYLVSDHEDAAWAVERIHAIRAAEADRLEKTVQTAIAEELTAHLSGRAAGDNAPDEDFPAQAATAVFLALKAADYRITRKD